MFSPIIADIASANDSSGAFILPFVIFSLYFTPSIIALAKRNRRTKVILFNIFLGWTVVMWIICLVWACKKDKRPVLMHLNISPADELKKYKELLDSGVITAEEFEKKKDQLFYL